VGGLSEVIVLCVAGLLGVAAVGLLGEKYRAVTALNGQVIRKGQAFGWYTAIVVVQIALVWVMLIAGMTALSLGGAERLLYFVLSGCVGLLGYYMNRATKLHIINLGLIILGAMALLLGLIPVLVYITGFDLPPIKI
jgi:hypothetical protein